MTETEQKTGVLKIIAQALNERSVTWALGASMLLYFKGIVPEFHDIDLMIADDDADAAQEILSLLGVLQPAKPNAKYKTKRFLEYIIDGVDVDVMVSFAVVDGEEIVDCSLKREQIVEWLNLDGTRIPLQSPALWCGYYERMGRHEKAEFIQAALENSSK